jgi:glutamate formiminotransferase / 5-formyltetrahydrofolate cyclo-ligase
MRHANTEVSADHRGKDGPVLECVVNVSEGQRLDVLDDFVRQCGRDLLDLHHDPHHHRSVFTLAGTSAARDLTRDAVRRLDLRRHEGVHPRLGVVDVVPFVPLDGSTMADAVEARDAFAAWASAELGVPCFLYGPERSLPEVRRRAWRDLAPDAGPPDPHPSAGALCVGARPVLVAYNVWLEQPSLELARSIAAAVRGPHLRALGLMVGDRAQVSMNLIAPDELGPGAAFDLVSTHAAVVGGELVGLLPQRVLERVSRQRWPLLDLGEDRTIEARLARRG